MVHSVSGASSSGSNLIAWLDNAGGSVEGGVPVRQPEHDVQRRIDPMLENKEITFAEMCVLLQNDLSPRQLLEHWDCLQKVEFPVKKRRHSLDDAEEDSFFDRRTEDDLVAMHAEGAHFIPEVTAESSFVQRDMDVASAVALGEGQDGNGQNMFNRDGSLASAVALGESQDGSGL